MDLPIDHFRLLGVSPSAQADAILRRLQSRCDSPPDQGFTHEAILQRETLLRRSADLLTDAEARADYESALLALSESHPNETVGMDLAASSEAAGLILLWEAGAAHEAFVMACQGLQPPQAPALGSGREADLTLVAALACRTAAEAEQQQRRYESAARILREGIELQQRMGKLPDQQALLEQELDALLPFRILDLLSRDLSAVSDHGQGLALLDRLVRHRGGLEGRLVTDDPSAMTQADFESFFQQIRCFLTVQEQIDLFSRWQAEDSAEAGLLGVLALTAAGFSRRKPELIEQARDQVGRLSAADLDPMPWLGCLDLLLGNVAEASIHFRAIQDPELVRWFAEHPGDDLAAQCEYCRAWLERDVLPGYRDVEAAGVDLDSWFADRDVQAYVDRLDRQRARASAASLVESLASTAATDLSPSTDGPDLDVEDNGAPEDGPDSMDAPVMPQQRRWAVLASGGLGVVMLSVLVFSLQRNRDPWPAPVEDASPLPSERKSLSSEPERPTSMLEARLQPEPPASSTAGSTATIEPLIVDRPDEQQLTQLIQGWLDSKAATLRGEPSQLAVVARPHMLKQVNQERAAAVAAGTTTSVQAAVTSLEVVSRQPRRIELMATVDYTDSTRDRSGTVLRTTGPSSLSITYILGRDGTQWRLTAYIPRG